MANWTNWKEQLIKIRPKLAKHRPRRVGIKEINAKLPQVSMEDARVPPATIRRLKGEVDNG